LLLYPQYPLRRRKGGMEFSLVLSLTQEDC